VESATGERARQGQKFGAAADDYERGRPGYPEAAIDAAAAGLELPPDATVVDLGAGTGKLTRVLAGRFPTVLAVEPLRPMRDRLVAAGLPGVVVREGSAERLPVADRSAQAVFVAEAFHWFDGPAALAEAARVLTPEGGIVLLWNSPAGPWQPPLPEPARELVRAALARGGEPGGARLARDEWRAAFAGARFGELQHQQVRHDLARDRDGVIANAMSISSIAGLPEPDRADLRRRLRELLADTDYRWPLRTDLYWARVAPWCDRCGGALADPGHRACAAARELEPPRFCRFCRRRMRVQVLPAGWTASCAAHGQTRPPGPDPTRPPGPDPTRSG
jgi:SAM-dependent methyltransferase